MIWRKQEFFCIYSIYNKVYLLMFQYYNVKEIQSYSSYNIVKIDKEDIYSWNIFNFIKYF